MIQNCNCTEKVDCGCSLEFSSYQTGTTSVLDVGTLDATGCTITGYVIDWYLSGELALVSASASGLTPEATAFHPFTGASAIPVLDGTYHPVVRFVVIGGEKVFTAERPCQKWCEMEIDLPDIVVNAITCSTTGGTPLAYYAYRISYVATQDWAMAGRRLRYVLPTDGSVINFAISFEAFTIADKISVYYNDSTDPMYSVVVGSSGGGSAQFSTMPYRCVSSAFKFIVGLPEYTVGDYLIIEVIPSVLETNYQTNWNADFKCLTSSDVIEYDYFDDAGLAYDIDTLALTYDSANCRYVLNMEYEDILLVQSSTNLSRYGNMANGSFSGGSFNATTNIVSLYIDDRFQPQYVTAGSGMGNIATRNKVTLSKSGSVYTILCTDSTEYNQYKNSLVAIQGSSFYTGWVNDNTDRRYYGYTFLYFVRSGSGGCGDTQQIVWFVFHPGCTISYDDGNKTITITVSTVTNGLTSGGACDGCYIFAQSIVNSINTIAGYSDFSYDSYCGYENPFYYAHRMQADARCSSQLEQTAGYACYFYGDKVLPGEMECIMQSTNFGIAYYGFWQYYLKLVITATRNSDCTWATDPLDNFKLYSYLDPITNLYTATPVLIYEKSGGVETTKRYYGT